MQRFQNVPRNVLLVKRIHSNNITAICCVLSLWLVDVYGCRVFVEAPAHSDFMAMNCSLVSPWEPTKTSMAAQSDLSPSGRPVIDLVISMGGDGTTLWAASLFQEDPIPPVLGVRLGSLSYINQFCATELLTIIEHIFAQGEYLVQERSRLFLSIYSSDAETLFYGHCINECAVGRGASSNMTSVDVFVNNHFFTSVSSDGLILSTPTGSTAYSMSAGGPVVHPAVSCILFTPVCPHSLSMRPVVLPSTAEIRLKVPDDARGSLWLSLDGHQRHEVKPGQHVIASLSPNPLPLICKSGCQRGDPWLQSLTDNLFWGLTVRQRRFDSTIARQVVYEALPEDMRKWYIDYKDRNGNKMCLKDTGEEETHTFAATSN